MPPRWPRMPHPLAHAAVQAARRRITRQRWPPSSATRRPSRAWRRSRRLEVSSCTTSSRAARRRLHPDLVPIPSRPHPIHSHPSPSPSLSPSVPGRSLLGSCSSDCYGTTCEEWDTNYGTDPTQCDWLASWGDINSDCDCSGCACDPPDPTSAPTTAAAPTPDPTVSEVPTTLPTPLPTLVPTTTLSPTTCWVVECGKVREVSGAKPKVATRAVPSRDIR